jgi:hypothetical protein
MLKFFVADLGPGSGALLSLEPGVLEKVSEKE